jgi:hypothetical protein
VKTEIKSEVSEEMAGCSDYSEQDAPLPFKRMKME